MKFNNKRIKYYSFFIYFTVIGCFAFSLFIKLSPFILFSSYPILPFIITGSIVWLIYRYYGHPFFEFDSDGEVLNLTTDEFIMGKIFPSTKKHSEFPKRKLASYKIKKKKLKKTLVLTLHSKKSNTSYSKLKFNITYLNNNKLRGLKKVLDKTLKEYNSLKNKSFHGGRS